MAYYSHIQHASLSERFLTSAANLLERMAARHAHRRIYRDSLNELTDLSDRELSDLGMHRSMLKGVALATANKKITLK